MTRVYEEWRLTVKPTRGALDLNELVAETRASAPDGVDVYRRRKDVAVYAFDQATLLRIEKSLRWWLENRGVMADLVIARWNPSGECWQDPKLPVEPYVRRSLQPEWVDVGEFGWEVRLRLPGKSDREGIEHVLRSQKKALVTDGWRRLTVGVPTESDARELGASLATDCPGAQIEVRPLSRWRRWLIAQAHGQNYAA